MLIQCVKTANTGHSPLFILSLGERTNIVHDSALIAFRIGASISKLRTPGKNTGKMCCVCTINACFACYKSLYSGNFVYIMTMMLTWTYAFSVRSCDLVFSLSLSLSVLVLLSSIYWFVCRSGRVAFYKHIFFCNVYHTLDIEYNLCVVYST